MPEKISDKIKNRPAHERAKVKGQEIAKQVRSVPRTQRQNYDIEIVETKAIEKGVEVYARAWKDGEQIGFGKDGTVDIERFVKYTTSGGGGKNGHLTHIVVPDPNGDIEVVDDVFNETGEKIGTRTEMFREDPQENVLIWLEHTISVMKNKHGSENIIEEKRGNTTTTVNPNSGTGTAPIDGDVLRSGTDLSWADIRGNAGTGVQETLTDDEFFILLAHDDGGWQTMKRGLFGFDTSSIGTDQVDSAIFSLYGSGSSDELGAGWNAVVDRNVPADGANFASSDYNIGNWDGVKQSDTEIAVASWNTSGYNDFTLNATGEGNVNGSGNSWYGLRGDFDFDNTEPTWEFNNRALVAGAFADNADSNKHPKLVVEHSAAATFKPKIMMY